MLAGRCAFAHFPLFSQLFGAPRIRAQISDEVAVNAMLDIGNGALHMHRVSIELAQYDCSLIALVQIG